jgi:hypothetical protein
MESSKVTKPVFRATTPGVNGRVQKFSKDRKYQPSLEPFALVEKHIFRWSFRAGIFRTTIFRTTLLRARPFGSGCRNIVKVNIADDRVFVPAIHRINGLRELGIAFLVDTASVDPYVAETIKSRLLASVLDFPRSKLVAPLVTMDVLKYNLLSTPSMREHRISRDIMTVIIFQPHIRHIQEAHREYMNPLLRKCGVRG